MVGLDQFLSLFGDITVTKIVALVLALFFCWKIYQQVQKFFDNKKKVLIEQHEAKKEQDEKINTLLEEVNKYPQYREQSRQIQKELRNEIDGVKEAQATLAEKQQEICDSLQKMQENNDRRERNKLRDRLLQSYRYYTNIESNPKQCWTSMESEAFWELFRDYEDAGGDGYIHTVVQPAMNLLKIIDN